VKQEIKKQLLGIALVVGKDLNELALNAYMTALSDLDDSSVMTILQNWLKTEKGFPFPSEIRSKVLPEISQDDNAVMVANLIMKSISMDGYTNPDRAKKRMGDLAWEVVCKFGGWGILCENTNSDNMGTIRAQLRGLASTTHKQALRGELDHVPSLPAPSNNVSSIIKTTFEQIGHVPEKIGAVK